MIFQLLGLVLHSTTRVALKSCWVHHGVFLFVVSICFLVPLPWSRPVQIGTTQLQLNKSKRNQVSLGKNLQHYIAFHDLKRQPWPSLKGNVGTHIILVCAGNCVFCTQNKQGPWRQLPSSWAACCRFLANAWVQLPRSNGTGLHVRSDWAIGKCDDWSRGYVIVVHCWEDPSWLVSPAILTVFVHHFSFN